MERDIRIDILKGIGIILVVWGHATAILIKEICIFHMPLFFFLAGMFYHPKQGFIQSRAKRLLIPFGEYSLIFAVFYFSMGSVVVLGRSFLYMCHILFLGQNR